MSHATGQTVKSFALLTLGPALHTLAFPPYGWTSLGWVALAPLFLFLRDRSLWQAFGAGLVYGTGRCVGVGDWLFATVMTHFRLPFPLDILFVIGNYVVFVGFATGLAAVLACLLMRTSNRVLCWSGIPALWVSGEFVHSDLTFGSSWGVLGYSQYQHIALIQIADLTGVYGLSFLMVLSAYVLAEWGSGCGPLRSVLGISRTAPGEDGQLPWLDLSGLNRLDRFSGFGLLAAVVGAVWLYGTIRIQQYEKSVDPHQQPAVPTLGIAIVQGDVPSVQRWKRGSYPRILLKYVSVSQRGMQGVSPDLIVWPEFALNFYLNQEPLLHAQLGRFTQRSNAPLLLGAPRMEERTAASQTEIRRYNSAYLLAPSGQILDWYDKLYLIPFAESPPFGMLDVLNVNDGSPRLFTQGERSTIFSLPQARFGVMICYEVIFPRLARRLVQGGAEFLVNISNETWLNDDVGAMTQHFAFTAFRAVENKRFLVRTATAGVSAFVDPLGRPSQWSMQKDGVLWEKVVPRRELTVYAEYGDWFAWGCVSFVLVAVWSGRKHTYPVRAAK